MVWFQYPEIGYIDILLNSGDENMIKFALKFACLIAIIAVVNLAWFGYMVYEGLNAGV